MIDTTTIRRTPARSPASCKLRAAVVKNAVAASCSGEGPLVVSTTHSTPASALARPSPVITSTPPERQFGRDDLDRQYEIGVVGNHNRYLVILPKAVSQEHRREVHV